jgi:hypothetical protein
MKKCRHQRVGRIRDCAGGDGKKSGNVLEASRLSTDWSAGLQTRLVGENISKRAGSETGAPIARFMAPMHESSQALNIFHQGVDLCVFQLSGEGGHLSRLALSNPVANPFV